MWHLLSDRVNPWGSLVTERPADAQVPATRSLCAWCLAVLTGDLLQTKLCMPFAFTKDRSTLSLVRDKD